MAEDDEIDILGDFNLDNFLNKNDSSMFGGSTLVSQNSELLNCDYTIHPQWLLDKPSTNPDCWYDNSSVVSTELPEKTPQAEPGCDVNFVSTENSITDESGWTEKEKNLLERGIEIFGKSNVRLAQFIGTKTSSQVKYYLLNFYVETHKNGSSFNSIVDSAVDDGLVSQVLADSQIPATMEEVIAVISTAKATVYPDKRIRRQTTSLSEDSETSVNKSNTKVEKVKRKRNVSTRSSSSEASTLSKKGHNNKVKFKMKTKLRVPLTKSTILKQKEIEEPNFDNQEKKHLQLVTGKGRGVSVCEGEEIVKIMKETSEDDSSSEIEIDDCDNPAPVISENKQQDKENIKQIKPAIRPPSIEQKPSNLPPNEKVHSSGGFNIDNLEKKLADQLQSMEEPKEELIIETTSCSDLEKLIHDDFFNPKPTKRGVKSPEKYLQIRNGIIQLWKAQKPSYLNKTAIRQGLKRAGIKNLGDVHTLSRIHNWLEQLGIINFGCSQTVYERPLSRLQGINQEDKPEVQKNSLKVRDGELGSRSRIKRKFNKDGEGGCTLTHNENGEVINTTIINEEPTVKQKIYIKKPIVRLIYCRPFPNDAPQEYNIRMRLSALLLMDYHAHSSFTEVMGLIAGHWDPFSKNVIISHYEPCKNIGSSATHCDMCPISQAKAAETINSCGLDILGWYHSHPTFAPEPSQQDLETQQTLQQWIGIGKPCVGVILSPFSLQGALIASPYRCMYVDKKKNFEDQLVPYKFKVDLDADEFDVGCVLGGIKKIRNFELPANREIVDFSKPYFHDNSITFLDKFIHSVRMNLAKCGKVHKSLCDTLIQKITRMIVEK